MTKIKANQQYTGNMSSMLRKYKENGEKGIFTRDGGGGRAKYGSGIDERDKV